VVLLPAPGEAPTADWQLAFNDRSATGVAHITTTVTVALAAASQVSSSSSTAPAAPAPAPAAPALPAVPAPLGIGPALLPPAPVTLPSAVPAPTVAGAGTPATLQAAPLAASSGFRYPEIFLLPLLLLAGAAYLGRVLTADLRPVRTGT
ncbi:MAG: hypothetical protein ACYDB7_11565, partial [Mycobacteriales bacterium]